MADLPTITSPTREAIFHGYEEDASEGFRPHLGASLIGKDCERALWYDFRWTTRSRFAGRVLRLFETGQLEEARLVRNLRRTGATVLEVDPQTGRQFRVEALGGHFGGSMDAVAINLLEAPKTWHVLEFKTHAAKSFADLVAKKVRESKPQHFAQMQVYMHLAGLTRACPYPDHPQLSLLVEQPSGAQPSHHDAGVFPRSIARAQASCAAIADDNAGPVDADLPEVTTSTAHAAPRSLAATRVLRLGPAGCAFPPRA